MELVATATIAQQVAKLEECRFQLEEDLLDHPNNNEVDKKRIELYGRRIAEITRSINLMQGS